MRAAPGFDEFALRVSYFNGDELFEFVALVSPGWGGLNVHLSYDGPNVGEFESLEPTLTSVLKNALEEHV